MLLNKLRVVLFWGCFGVGLAPAGGVHADIGDVLAAPLKWVGGALGGGAADKFKGALDKTLVDVDTRLVKHEDRIAGLADQFVSNTQGKIDSSVDHVDHALEARILQLKTSADDSVTRALSQVDSVAKERLLQVQGVIGDADQKVTKALDHADTILRERSRDVGQMADSLVSHADAAIEARISQIDEAAGRRLGNVDVIASKQRLALEQGGIRLAILIGMVVFVVFVLRSLWQQYNRQLEQGAFDDVRGARRSARVVRNLTPTFVRSVLGALVGLALLTGLQAFLPNSAARETDQLTQTHRAALIAAVARFDATQARYHASQLQYLRAEDAAYYSGLSDKAGLLRDLIVRPAILTTQQSLDEFAARVRAAERALGPRPDPDILAMQAIIAWSTGPTRADEHRAASLAARALRLAPAGFALSPLARAYVETFLDAPYVQQSDSVGLGRDADSLEDLAAAADRAAPDRADSPLLPAVLLARSMRTLQRVSGAKYVELAQTQAKIVAAATAKRAVAAQLLDERKQLAQKVVDAWVAFDRSLQANDGATGALVLSVFRLNDAQFTRAARILAEPDSLEIPAAVSTLHGADTLALRLKIAPPRIAWTRRYATFFEAARPLVEFEEAERYRDWERWCIELEQALVELEDSRDHESTQPAAQWRVVLASAALGLYVEGANGPRPFSLVVACSDPEQPTQCVQQAVLAQEGARAPKAGPRAKQQAGAGPRVAVEAPTTLDEALLMRGPRMI